MTDASIGIAECPTPTHEVDNEELVTTVGTVYRQRVSDPETHAALGDILAELQTEVLVANLPLDIFANLVTGERDNQIEVHFDDTNYANYLTHTTASGGSRSQSNGQVRYSTGTSATGRIQAVTVDTIKYRPMHEVYAGWTSCFLTAGVANSWQRVGLFTANDGVFVGYEGTSFGLTHRNNGVATHIARASWDDPCDGSPTSRFTRDNVPEVLDPAKQNVWRLRLGWLGSAGWIMEVLSPDLNWVAVHTYHHANTSATPYLANADLPQALDVGKTSGATDFVIGVNCWAGGTTSSKARLSDPITDRSLAETVRAVITGKTTGGGGGYVDVKVNPSGAIVADVTGSTVTVNEPVTVDGTVLASEKHDLLAYAEELTTDGSITPAAGKQIQVLWVQIIPNPDNTTANLVTIGFAGGTRLYRTYALGRSAEFTGAVDEVLNIDLTNANPVAVNIHYRELP